MKTLILVSVLSVLSGCASWTPEQRHTAEVIAVSVAATSIALSMGEEKHRCDHIGCYNHSHGIGPQVQP